MPLIRPKPYQSPLWAHLETIRKLRWKRQTWAAIALHLKESHGVETTAATVFKFFKRAAIRSCTDWIHRRSHKHCRSIEARC